MRNLLKNKNLQVIISLFTISIIIIDLITSDSFYQEEDFILIASIILLVNTIRHKIKTNKVINTISIISVIGLLGFSFCWILIFIWGISYSSGEIPFFLIISFTIIVTLGFLLLTEILTSNKLPTTQK
jgi:hypothetical protein